MKRFVKYTLATVCGVLISGVLMAVVAILLVFFFVLGSVGIDRQKGVSKEHSFLRLTLNGPLCEDERESVLEHVFGRQVPCVNLREVVTAVREAKVDDSIDGIFIRALNLTDVSPAMAHELREALCDFRKSGKHIVAYGDFYTQASYYICSVADSVLVNPQGHVDWHGLAVEPVFYKDLFARLGIEMQVFRVGAYKAAVEPFTADEMSEENRVQVRSYLSDIWGTIVGDVSASRLISGERLEAYADSLTIFLSADSLAALGLVDGCCYLDSVSKMLRELTRTEKGVIPLVSASDLCDKARLRGRGARQDVVVYYATGEIMTEGLGLADGVMEMGKVMRDLRRLRQDETVGAVVLRINSGGGSAYASEQIWNEVRRLKEQKPVVVSMSGAAASGGYYIGCAADYLVADANTLTGSIGIFGMVPDASGLLGNKLGLRFDAVKTNEHSDFGSLARGFDSAEKRQMQAFIERGYDLFTQRVAQGRGMDIDTVLALAQGRVWTGGQAVENRLVDTIGSLDVAVKKAGELAKISDYGVRIEPEAEPWYASWWETSERDYFNLRVRAMLGALYEPLMFLYVNRGADWAQARMPYEINLLN